MLTNEIEKLLKLQECDTEKLEAELRLKRIPLEIKKYQDKIKSEEEKLETARNSYKGMEVRRSEMKGQRQSDEEQIAKYKTQQLLVKKNDEYQALTHEIEVLEEKLSNAEEEEIGLLLEIDDERDRLSIIEEEIAKEMKLCKDHVLRLNERETKVKAEIGDIVKSVEVAESKVDAQYLKTYSNVKQRFKKPPFVVPMIDKKVNGLVVSNDVEAKAKKGEELVVCDNTGRIVYAP